MAADRAPDAEALARVAAAEKQAPEADEFALHVPAPTGS